jgi:hypothetical protein
LAQFSAITSSLAHELCGMISTLTALGPLIMTLNDVNLFRNNTMNSNNTDYDFQTKVLMADAIGKGAG